jgi:hypothetical protein
MIDKPFHFANGLVEPHEDGAGDDRMTNIQFSHPFDCGDRLNVDVVEAMPCV